MKMKITDKELSEKRAIAGRKGGKSKSKAKRVASRRNVKTFAWPGVAMGKLRRDVEQKILTNRKVWLVADNVTRMTLDVQFEKLVKLLKQFEKKNGQTD